MSQMQQLNGNDWKKVLYAHECAPCDMCEEPVCAVCEMHYAECSCPGPHQDEVYEYRNFGGVEYARKLDDG